MGFRFSKSFRLLPGVRLNLSKRGISATAGRPGASINIGRRGVRATTGVPGSGLSYSTELYRADESAGAVSVPADKTLGVRLLKRLFGRGAGERS